MGMEITSTEDGGVELLQSRPSILLLGSAGVGKSSILNRLRQNDHAASYSSTGVVCYGWKIDTKYYTADVGIWIARLEQADGEDRLRSLSEHCEALVMVFDLSNDSTFDCVKNWASGMDLTRFDILLCVGNKADRLPEHQVHVEYRRRLQRRGESSSDPHPDFADFGIQRSEGSALLNDEDTERKSRIDEKRQNRMSWCIDNGIEYIEACALSETFDDCLSVDGDLQGVMRVRGALSAHMWQGLIMKPTTKQLGSESQPEESHGFSSEEDSDFTIEYELLSNGSEGDEPFDASENGSREPQEEAGLNEAAVVEEAAGPASPPAPSATEVREQGVQESRSETNTTAACNNNNNNNDRDENMRLDEFERMMQEMAGMRDSLRVMPDAQRREMASQIALRMAQMFMDDDEDDD